MSEVKVLQIPRGSLIVLNGVDFVPHESHMMERFIEGLHDKCGHDEFLILNVGGDGTTEVFGTVDEAVEAVQRALDDAGIPRV